MVSGPMIAIGVAFVVSCALTEAIRRYCLAKGIVDVPNQRSSHDRIVARGGGIGFSVIFLAALLVFGALGMAPWPVVIGFFGGGCVIAGTGWVDDQRGLSQVTRILMHLLAAVWAVAWIGPVPPVFSGSEVWKLLSQCIGVLAIVWMVNLYNFMDGTDGIAGVEAVSAAALGGGLCAIAGVAAVGQVYGVLAGAVAGFLVWNWPPARIFMGDAGSGRYDNTDTPDGEWRAMV
jgi:Fuc2NAc and GlcNAc transferase